MEQKVKTQGKGLTFGLAVQFLLGMAINLYVTFPENADIRQNWEFARHNWWVILHMLLGTLLVIGAITLLLRSIRGQVTEWRWPAALGLIFILLAWLSGEVFVGTQKDLFSYLMATGFVLAMLSYIWGISRSK